ncbi:AraC family transcriptional regulator [Mucilaginibacter sp. MD40]|uniref:helix-turn-helix domain-containing protein n=1 Tax=Mucilaginibacter sp. MD40 TaxID=2029590 RepID=UPI000BACB6BD|nr:helix-turn-helix transcriptional regulator [Mucilaginibacter sp. MD40]PAW92297.1 AraC family transcriptional regulator [Mucilaginibacter sp. MD40]
METPGRLQDVSQFNKERGQVTYHPLVTVLDQSKSCQIRPYRFVSDLYIVFFKQEQCADMLYGRSRYDYQGQTLIFIAPGQVAGLEGDALIQPNGYALAFHPDFIHGTSLGRQIRNYHFFSYDVREALHVSDREKELLTECFRKIIYELSQPIDKHTRKLIATNIELLLDYCERFYDRQFITREHLNKDILTRFEDLLNHYFNSENLSNKGLPTVAFCAGELALSPKYFGDLIKKETGQTAQEYIQSKLIDLAKEKMSRGDRSISEIAYSLGFKYPQHFTRLFKQHVGRTPVEYRHLNSISNQ